MNAIKEMLAGLANTDAGYPDADPDATLFEYRLCLYCCWFNNVSKVCPCAVYLCIFYSIL